MPITANTASKVGAVSNNGTQRAGTCHGRVAAAGRVRAEEKLDTKTP